MISLPSAWFLLFTGPPVFRRECQRKQTWTCLGLQLWRLSSSADLSVGPIFYKISRPICFGRRCHFASTRRSYRDLLVCGGARGTGAEGVGKPGLELALQATGMPCSIQRATFLGLCPSNAQCSSQSAYLLEFPKLHGYAAAPPVLTWKPPSSTTLDSAEIRTTQSSSLFSSCSQAMGSRARTVPQGGSVGDYVLLGLLNTAALTFNNHSSQGKAQFTARRKGTKPE